MRVRPTTFGVALGAIVVAVRVLGPPTADPGVTGFVWASVAVMVVMGACWPPLALAGLRAEVLDAPEDLVVGDTGDVLVAVRRGPISCSLRLVEPGAEAVDLGAPTSVHLPVRFEQRGVYDTIVIEARTDAPFGIMRARRRIRLPLPRTLYVAPSPLHQEWDPTTGSTGPDGPPSSATAMIGDTVRSVRPYVAGDPSHLVHWPSSARTGQLVVRELEPPVTPGLAVVVDLTGDLRVAEVTAARAAGLVAAVFAAGGRVALCTAGPDGPRTNQPVDVRAAGRQLAAAVAGRPGEPPTSWDVEHVTAHGVPA